MNINHVVTVFDLLLRQPNNEVIINEVMKINYFKI